MMGFSFTCVIACLTSNNTIETGFEDTSTHQEILQDTTTENSNTEDSVEQDSSNEDTSHTPSVLESDEWMFMEAVEGRINPEEALLHITNSDGLPVQTSEGTFLFGCLCGHIQNTCK